MMRQLTTAELNVIAGQIDWVRERWQRIPNIPHCNFDGSRDDLRALDYVAYEGLDAFFKGEGQTGYARFAIVFGNVLVQVLGFAWIMDENTDERFLLRHHKVSGVIDPIRLIREESENAGWRCPDFERLFERLAAAVENGGTG